MQEKTKGNYEDNNKNSDKNNKQWVLGTWTTCD